MLTTLRHSNAQDEDDPTYVEMLGQRTYFENLLDKRAIFLFCKRQLFAQEHDGMFVSTYLQQPNIYSKIGGIILNDERFCEIRAV
ncbi:hypothetical protein TNIN_204251 [Trichonephila inaurata madagascariensis]|uniref:Uncharacterized protein n=1 Tax=Trichonephila inaurata madagascariensis TaxID=2747483 RepID=A0A8X6Y8S0_9ARAC|nr:hypothetical protein TNIN_204251 [Trichonephila inaurata madagascariensis]